MKEEDLENICSTIGSEGFDYCFCDYTDFKEVEDKKFNKLRFEYVESKKKLEYYLKSVAIKFGLQYEDLLG